MSQPAAQSASDTHRIGQHCATAVLSHLFEPGRLDIYALVVEHGPESALDRVLSGHAGRILAAKARGGVGKAGPAVMGERLLKQARRCSARLVIPGDAEWPGRLTDLAALTVDDGAAAPPIALWIRGERVLSAATERSVAIVGARAATGYGRYVASDIARDLASAGWTVVSGGAYGIDAAAHRGALAADGMTVAVLACGVDVAYPQGNRELLERIAELGLVISEWPPGSGPRRYRFLIRNRVIAALSNGTVVVEAARRSGSRVTARRAEELNRSVMAVPGPVNSQASMGAHELIRDWGARLVTNAVDVIGEVGGIGEGFAAALAVDEPDSTELGEDHLAVLKAAPAQGNGTVQDLAVQCGLAPYRVRSVLPDLVARGLVIERSHGYQRTNQDPRGEALKVDS